MKQTFAVVVTRIPLNPRYPWKAGQRPVAEILGNAVSDASTWLECVDHGTRVQTRVTIIEQEER